jgi:RimJ/RimL family protein N-acetyltransferase
MNWLRIHLLLVLVLGLFLSPLAKALTEKPKSCRELFLTVFTPAPVKPSFAKHVVVTDRLVLASDDDLNGRYFHFIAFERDSGVEVGGLSVALQQKLPELEIGLYPPFQDMGYGMEAEIAFFSYLFENTDIERFGASIARDNVESLRLHQKLGFRWNPFFETNFNLTKKRFLQARLERGNRPHSDHRTYEQKKEAERLRAAHSARRQP